MTDSSRSTDQRWSSGLAVCVGLGLVALVPLAFARTTLPPASQDAASTEVLPEQVVDERTAAYFEDEDGRPIAQMIARLIRTDEGVHVEYSASAFGTEIEPPPGYEGVPGSNLTTAREIDALIARGDLRMRLEDLERARHDTITPRAGPARAVPLRGVRPDGRIDYGGASQEAFTASFAGRSKALPEGSFQLLIESGGSVRARCRFEIHDGGGAILDLAGVPHPLQRTISRDP